MPLRHDILYIERRNGKKIKGGNKMFTERKDIMEFLENLPTLEGSEKQVAWAESIRENHYLGVLYFEEGQLRNTCIEDSLEDAGTKREDRFKEKYGINYTQLAEAEKSLTAITSAKWWIENKEIANAGHGTWKVLAKLYKEKQ